MTTSINIILVLLCTMTTIGSDPISETKMVQDDKYAQCLTKSSSEWGSNCGSCYNSSKSYRVNMKNVCDEKLDVKLVVQEQSMRWKTFNQNNMMPGDSLSGYACEGTGKYVFWARKAGDNTVVFPTDEEVEKEFAPKK